MIIPIFYANKYMKAVNIIREYSEQFNREYEIEDTVRIVNTKQAGLYIKNNVPLIDIFWSKDNLVFVFNKNESKRAYQKWLNHELL